MTPMTQHLKLTASALVIAATLGSVVLAGCNQPASQTATAPAAAAQPALPLTSADVPQSANAPLATALPAAPVKVVHVADQSQRYAYADRAYRYARVLADAPPDYTFDYDGVRPYVWNSGGAYQVAEPTSGGERYYYFDPGADTPYLVRDGGYSYGYDRGQLAVVYDAQGRTLDPSYVDQRADIAGRYLARARALRAAALSSQRKAVAIRNWEVRRQQMEADRAAWERQQQDAADWRAYHDAHDGQADAYWQAERQRRQDESRRYDQAIGSAYNQGRNDQGAQDAGRGRGTDAVITAAALAAAAAAFNAGRHDHDRGGPPPPPPPRGGPGFGDRGPDRGPGGPRGPNPQDDARRQAEEQQRLNDQQRQLADQQRQLAEQQRQAGDAGRRQQIQQQQQQLDQQRHQLDQQRQAQEQQQRQQQDAARQAQDQQHRQQAAQQQQAQAQAAQQKQQQQDAARQAQEQQRQAQAAQQQHQDAARQAAEQQQRAQQEAARKAAAEAQAKAAQAQAKPAPEQPKPRPVEARRDQAPANPDRPHRGVPPGQEQKQPD